MGPSFSSCRAVTVHGTWAHMGPGETGKPFESTPWYPNVTPSDLLLLSPSACSHGRGLRHVWGVGTPGTPFGVDASDAYAAVEAKGFLRSFKSHELDAYRAYVDDIISHRGANWRVWITPILGGMKCNFELVDLLRRAGFENGASLLPRSSLRWPHFSRTVVSVVRSFLTSHPDGTNIK